MLPRWLLCCAALCFTSDAAAVIHALNTHAELQSMVGRSGQKPVLIKFATPHCPACLVMDPVFKRLVQEYHAQLDFGEVNILINQEAQWSYSIQSVPTFIFFINGAVHQRVTVADERTLRMWTSSVAGGFIPQSQPQQPQQQLQQHQQQPQQYQQQPQGSAQLEQPHQRHAGSLIVSGACDSSLNDVFAFKGFTASNSPYYESASNRHLYHDFDCNGKGSTPRWILDDYNAPIASKLVDLDNDNDCRYRARLDWADGTLPLGTRRWRVYCGSSWVTSDLTIEEAYPPAATTTTTTTTIASSACANGIEDVVVIGGGPAGMAAALYAARAGLHPTVVAPLFGGQLLSKGVDVQNYPGVFEETGANMIATMREQVERFDAKRVTDLVVAVDTSKNPFTITTTDAVLKTRTIILAMGAESKWLGVPGEHDFRGHGVSSCAACDGFLFKGKRCVVIGGGESALEAALMLTRICSSVTILHRRDKFRARQVLQVAALKNPNIRVVWNTVVERFLGIDDGQHPKMLTHIQLKESGSSSGNELLRVDGAFVSIGHLPNTDFLRGQVELDEQGYIVHPSRSSQTSVPGVFAGGDVSDPIYRQAITSAGSGAMAALDAEKYLSELEIYDTPDALNLTLLDMGADSLHHQSIDLGINIASAVALSNLKGRSA